MIIGRALFPRQPACRSKKPDGQPDGRPGDGDGGRHPPLPAGARSPDAVARASTGKELAEAAQARLPKRVKKKSKRASSIEDGRAAHPRHQKRKHDIEVPVVRPHSSGVALGPGAKIAMAEFRSRPPLGLAERNILDRAGVKFSTWRIYLSGEAHRCSFGHSSLCPVSGFTNREIEPRLVQLQKQSEPAAWPECDGQSPRPPRLGSKLGVRPGMLIVRDQGQGDCARVGYCALGLARIVTVSYYKWQTAPKRPGRITTRVLDRHPPVAPRPAGDACAKGDPVFGTRVREKGELPTYDEGTVSAPYYHQDLRRSIVPKHGPALARDRQRHLGSGRSWGKYQNPMPLQASRRQGRLKPEGAGGPRREGAIRYRVRTQNARMYVDRHGPSAWFGAALRPRLRKPNLET